MKPDQHKKKRSAQYKRKHGKTEKKEVTNTSSSKETAPSTNGNVSKTPSADESEHAECMSSKFSQNKDFSRDVPEEVRRFSRRKIESNWNRYDHEPLEEGEDDISHAGLKGADFTTLLNQTGDVSSQFRFKDEQIWEDDQTGTSKQQGLDEGIPAVDCHHLSQQLMAIPLPVRLGIDQSFFEVSVLKSMDEIALRHQAKLDSAHTKTSLISGNHNKSSQEPSERVLNAIDDDDVLFDDGDDEMTQGDMQDLSQPPSLDAVEDQDTPPDVKHEETKLDNSTLPKGDGLQDPADSSVGRLETSTLPKGDGLQDPADSSVGRLETSTLPKGDGLQDPADSSVGRLETDPGQESLCGERGWHQTSSCVDGVTGAPGECVVEKEDTRCPEVTQRSKDDDRVVESDRTQFDAIDQAVGEDCKARRVESVKTLDPASGQRNNQTSIANAKLHTRAQPTSSSSRPINQAKTNVAIEPSKTETEDDELDFLLSLENPVQTRANIVSSVSHEAGGEEDGRAEQESLPGSHQDADLQPKSTPKPVKGPGTAQNGSDSLDDWLDSVLGE